MRTTLVAAVVAISGAAMAQPGGAPAKPAEAPPAKMEVPKPGAEHAAIKPWVKNWTCTGKTRDPRSGAEDTHKVTIKQKFDLGNYWASYVYTRSKGKVAPAFTSSGMYGYDLASKKYVMGGMDSWGGWINLTSGGPTGTTIVYEGESSMMGTKMPTKFEMVIDEKTKGLKITGTSGGQMVFEDTCK